MCRKPGINLFGARGFSLVELMVAVVIGLLVLAAVSTVMVNSKKNYTVQDSLARLQENARVAVDFVTRDLRTVGYYGCSNDHAEVNNLVKIDGANSLYDVSYRIEAVENGSATWYPTAIKNADLNLTGIVPGTDALTLRFKEGAGVPIIAPYMTDPTAALTIDPGSNLSKGDIVMVADCASADVFQITSDAPNTSGTLEHKTGVGSPGNVTAEFGKNKDKMYEDKSFIAKLTAVRYFVGARCTTTGAKCATGENNGAICTKADSCKCDHEHRCSLFRQKGGTIEELVEGIESMQILYGKDTDDPVDRVPNVYVSGDNVGDAAQWLRVVSVRIGLLAYTQASETESGEYGGVTDSGPYDVNGTELSVAIGNLEAKRVKRRVFTTTVALRNHQ
jgi:type IV pilus assembly protein PilW